MAAFVAHGRRITIADVTASLSKAVVLCLVLMLPAFSLSARIDQVVQVEDFSDTSGVSWSPIEFKSQNPRVAFEHCGNGDWIRFDSVAFLEGQYDSLSLYYWSSWPQDLSGATIRFRLGSPTGTVIATFSDIRGTGGYGYQLSTPMSVSLPNTIGYHTIYMTFSGSSDFCTVDKFRLSGVMTVADGDAVTYYVDGSRGLDTGNDGRAIDRPFKTIQRAASVMKPGSRCLIRQGIYRETIRPLYTGMPGAPLTFEPYNGEIIYISGADPVTGWVQHSGNVYKAHMNWTLGKYYDQVLVDGTMAWVARTPNVEENYKPHPWLEWCGGMAGPLDASHIRSKADPITLAAKVCFGINGTQSGHDGNFPPFDMDVENNQDPISTGEYRLPSALFGRSSDFFKGGLISVNNFYWSSIGEITGSTSPSPSRTVINAEHGNWNSMVVDANGPGWISHVFGLLDSPNEWYRQSDGTLYLWAPAGDNPSHHLVEVKRRVIGLDLRGKQNVTVKNIRFIATSATLADARDCILDGCQFKYVSHCDVFHWYETGAGYFSSPWDPTDGYSGVYISGQDNIFRNGLAAVSARSGIILSGRNNTVTNSIIRDCDYTVAYQAGILVTKRYVQDQTDASSFDIMHNTLKFCARGNVQISFASDPQTTADRSRVMYNDFGPAAFTTKETGSLTCQGSQGMEVAYNWFHGTAGRDAGDIIMEYDFGARHYIVHHNVFWQGESIIQNEQVASHWSFDWNDDRAMCFNNTVVDSSGPGHRDWDMDWPGYKRNNIMAMSDTAPWRFSDPGHRDYTLRSGSPAIDAGVVVPGWVETFNGTAPDLGAYEYGQPRWTAGADWQEQRWVYPPSALSTNGGLSSRGSTLALPNLEMVHGRIVVSGLSRSKGAFQLFNAKGALIAGAPLNGEDRQMIDIPRTASGLCLARIRTAGRTFVRKVSLVR